MAPSTNDVLNHDVISRAEAPLEPSFIRSLRGTADETDHACAVLLSDETETYLVVSPRGTCILLDDFLKTDSWPPSEHAENIAQDVTRQIA